jgi:threonine aldolase
MRFLSDSAAPVCPQVMRAIDQANSEDDAYDGDRLSQGLDAAFSTLFEREVAVVWISTGTAANALALSLLCPPFGAILAHDEGHVLADECGAVELYSGGARLIGCGGDGGKLSPAILAARMALIRPDVHQMQPRAVTITNATECGRVYAPGEVAAIGDFARRHGLALHMDGARFANAVAHLGCAPAEVTWRAGVEALSFGFTKNGAMNAEALVLFDTGLAQEARIRRKRAGHLLAKGRFIAAQLHALLAGDLWLAHGRAANVAAQCLAEAAGPRLLQPVEANELFISVSVAEAAALRGQGFAFHDWGQGIVRLVTSWHHRMEDVAPLGHALRAL